MINTFDTWGLARIVLLIVSFSTLILFIQVTLSHNRGRFHKKAMWLPIIILPLLVLSSLLTITFSQAFFAWMLAFLSIVAVLEGLIGTALHLRAINARTGGWNSENVMNGPPFLLPLLISLFGGLNLFVLFYR